MNKNLPSVPPVFHPARTRLPLLPAVAQAQPRQAMNAARAVVPPPVYRPQAAALQRKAGTTQAGTVKVPPVFRPFQMTAGQPTAQAKFVAPAGTRTIQRASANTGAAMAAPVTLGKYQGQMSEGKNYFIPDGWNNELIYATAAPRSSAVVNKLQSINADGKTYQPYVSQSAAATKKFVKDCLHTAEEVNAGAELKPLGDYSKLSLANQTVRFGTDDASNIAAATTHGQDALAAPGLGQAYVSVNTQWPGGAASPYHAAAVVAVDGNDRITLEVFASTKDGKRTVTYAQYRMYSVGAGSKPTFHKFWLDKYFKDPNQLKTIVIEPA